MRVILAVVPPSCRNPRPRLVARLPILSHPAGHGMYQLGVVLACGFMAESRQIVNRAVDRRVRAQVCCLKHRSHDGACQACNMPPVARTAWFIHGC